MLRKRTCLGIDVSDKDIKIVELSKSGDKYQIIQASRLEIGTSGVAETLRRFFAETDTHGSEAYWSLPTHECAVKFAKLPKSGQAEIARMARYEAESQMPLPLADLNWGYSAGRPSKENGLCHIVIAAARRETVKEVSDQLEESGVKSCAAMVASLAETAVVQRTAASSDHSVLVVNIGDEWTDITTISKGEVISCRSLRMGVSSLQFAAADDLYADADEACESISRESFISEDNKQAVLSWISNLSSELHRSVLASVNGSGTSVKSAVITGDGATISGLAKILAVKTGLQISAGDPWSEMILGKVAAYGSSNDSSIYSVATGLAIIGIEKMSSINLLPSEREEDDRQRRKEMLALAMCGIIPILLLSIFFISQSIINSKRAELDAIRQSERSTKSKNLKQIDPDIRKTAALMETIDSALKDDSKSPLEILKQLSQNLPKSCWLSQFQYNAGKNLVLRGNALSNSSIADAVYMLSITKMFDSVSLDYSNLGKGTQTPVYEFQIKCVLPPDMSIITSSKQTKTAKERIVVR